MCIDCLSATHREATWDSDRGFYRFSEGYARAMIVVSDPERGVDEGIALMTFDLSDHDSMFSFLYEAYISGHTPLFGVVARDEHSAVNVFNVNGELRVFRGVAWPEFQRVIRDNNLHGELLDMLGHGGE